MIFKRMCYLAVRGFNSCVTVEFVHVVAINKIERFVSIGYEHSESTYGVSLRRDERRENSSFKNILKYDVVHALQIDFDIVWSTMFKDDVRCFFLWHVNQMEIANQ